MNIFKREMKIGRKTFLFWLIGLFFLDFAGMTKYTGIAASNAGIDKIIAEFPRVVLAVLGMVDVDINTLGGYYSLISYFAMIITVIYAIHLGANAVSREGIDKTYEFVFTKPRSRTFILNRKLAAGYVYLLFFAMFHYIFSAAAIAVLQLENTLQVPMLLFSLAIFLAGTVFFFLSAFFSALAVQAERGMQWANFCFLFAFIMGILYDMTENADILRALTPFKYFLSKDLLQARMDFLFAGICIVLAILLYLRTQIMFRAKDLKSA